jgi:hypothetical protein
MAESMEAKIVRIETKMEEQSRQIDTLISEVKDLVAAMNKGRGAFGFAMMLATGMGAAASLFVTYITK